MLQHGRSNFSPEFACMLQCSIALQQAFCILSGQLSECVSRIKMLRVFTGGGRLFFARRSA